MMNERAVNEPKSKTAPMSTSDLCPLCRHPKADHNFSQCVSTMSGPQTCRTCMQMQNALQAILVPSACPVCGGERWVCEDHPERAWGEGDGCCGGAGMPCLVCNAGPVPKYPPGSTEVWHI